MPTPYLQRVTRIWHYLSCLVVANYAVAALGVQNGIGSQRRPTRFERVIAGYADTPDTVFNENKVSQVENKFQAFPQPHDATGEQKRLTAGAETPQRELPRLEVGTLAQIQQQVPEEDYWQAQQRLSNMLDSAVRSLREANEPSTEEQSGVYPVDEQPVDVSSETSDLDAALLQLQQRLGESDRARLKVGSCLEKLRLLPRVMDARRACRGERDEVFDHCVQQIDRWVQRGKLSSVFHSFEVNAGDGNVFPVILPNPPYDFLFYARLLGSAAKGPCPELRDTGELGLAVASFLYTDPAAMTELSAKYRRRGVPQAAAIKLLLAFELLARLFFRYASWFVENPMKLFALNQACRVRAICRRLVLRSVHRSLPLTTVKTPLVTARWFEGYLKKMIPNRGARVIHILGPLVAETLVSSFPEAFTDVSQGPREGEQMETPPPRRRQSLPHRVRNWFSWWRHRTRRQQRNRSENSQ
ncbi:hypothetical protein TGGT1_312950 [Toxoplasma gondii GT1]|uniref:Transmembrane protein n=3 Tax=Toxoplasma gondii TaxID=5811 RepID=S7W1L8_TOXGG|nr:hypothetical protein TGGT1_312950 [Toxoplasma gondii GT1]KAF4639434.1 hypothetical protein TGRH88_052060 [Toxoplasma gondii]KFH09752.1 putative transmembrane protein [Toxoplasma gondii VAND]